jgi:ribose transport system ATP-binding protein
VIDTDIAPTTQATIELSGICKSYAGAPALTDVSVEVLPGEVHAILGENGAGKSTLINVASGTVQPDSGTIIFSGDEVTGLTPRSAAALGISIVHQHPAVLPDMTVLENLQVALPRSVFSGSPTTKVARELLDGVGLQIHLGERVESLTLAEKHLLEIAKAFAVEPRLLILDEPTAPLGADAVSLLFGRVRETVAAGTSVVYITHRLAEVRELADRVTVLRDGRVRGTSPVEEVSDPELLALIVGRTLESTFPPKRPADRGEVANFVVEKLSGAGFSSVSLSAHRGEIVGLAGVVGNGQSDLLRALAGLEPFSGSVTVGGRGLRGRDLLNRAAYMPADRLSEGLMRSLSVRENAAVSALRRFRRGPLLSRRAEVTGVRESLGSLSVKAPSLDATVTELSGGNQQKVMIARALLSQPAILVADEPTQGVDVGARAEIYAILRSASEDGVPVIVSSSDSKELEGLCDRVLVMSRGQVVATLTGDDVTEEQIVSNAVTSTAKSVQVAARQRASSSWIRRFVQGDYTPSVLLVLVMLGLAAYITPGNDRYLTDFNIYTVLTAATATGFIALGQNIALLTGGIDLSVGPLAGFLVVIASFYANEGTSAGRLITGLGLMVLAAILCGLVNGFLIRVGKFTPIAATLTLYIALGGLAFLLRSTQGGFISTTIQDDINYVYGPIPAAFVILVVVALVLEGALRWRPWGWRLRAVGSDEESARRIGIPVTRTIVLAYVGASLLTFLGAIILMGQYGIGDPSQGQAFTLTSVTAVVLGGTSLLGGRGTFIGTVLGALLLQQLLNATTFLGLGSTSQYYFQGLLILVAAVIYTLARRHRKRGGAAG